jgi:YVTN family beta-propeller protein
MWLKVVVSLVRTALVVAVIVTVCGVASAATEPAKLHVGLSASFVISGGGSLWASDSTGSQVVRIDPHAGRVSKRIGVPGRPFGLAYGAGSVWVGSRYAGRVTRLSVRTNRRQARVSVGSSPYALAFGGGSVWVTNEGSGTVSRIGPRRNKVIRTIRVGGRPNGIAVAFRKVWVADYGRGRLIRIDPARNRVERRISIPKADWITASADSLWVSSETGKVYRVDPATLAVRATVTVGANPLAGAWIGGELWVPNIDAGTVSVVSASTNATRLTIAVGPSPIAVAGAAGSAWVTSDLDGDLWRLDAAA